MGVAAAETHERAAQRQVDDTEPARRDRDRGDDAHERPGSERLDRADLRRRYADGPERDEQHREDAEAPHRRGGREHMPAALDEASRRLTKALEARPAPR